MKLKVVPYVPARPCEFEREASRIAGALKSVAIAVHHIGSTAIPGIPAKPIIDILVEITDLPSLDARPVALVSLGYESMGEFGIPRRRYFRKNNAAGVRTHHIHAFEKTSEGAMRGRTASTRVSGRKSGCPVIVKFQIHVYTNA